MKNTYQSSPGRVFLCWVITLPLTTITFLSALGLLNMWLNIHRDTFLALLPFVVCFSIVIASTLTLYYWNIRVEVNAREVVFWRGRGRKPYLRFKFSENRFTSVLDTSIHEFYKTTTRFLRVFPLNGKKSRDYKFHNFSHHTFQECMAHISSHNSQQELQQKVIILDEEGEEVDEPILMEDLMKQSLDSLETQPLEFNINKQHFINRKRKTFLALAIPAVTLILLLSLATVIMPILSQNQHALDHFASGAGFLLLLAAIGGVLVVVMGWIPYKKVREYAPEKIVVYHNRIIIDEKAFEFRNITQIRMTTLNTEGNYMPVLRTLTINENHLSTSFVLGDDTDKIPNNNRRKERVKAFEDYPLLFNTLQNIFALRKEENSVSIFTPV